MLGRYDLSRVAAWPVVKVVRQNPIKSFLVALYGLLSAINGAFDNYQSLTPTGRFGAWVNSYAPDWILFILSWPVVISIATITLVIMVVNHCVRAAEKDKTDYLKLETLIRDGVSAGIEKEIRPLLLEMQQHRRQISDALVAVYVFDRYRIKFEKAKNDAHAAWQEACTTLLTPVPAASKELDLSRRAARARDTYESASVRLVEATRMFSFASWPESKPPASASRPEETHKYPDELQALYAELWALHETDNSRVSEFSQMLDGYHHKIIGKFEAYARGYQP